MLEAFIGRPVVVRTRVSDLSRGRGAGKVRQSAHQYLNATLRRFRTEREGVMCWVTLSSGKKKRGKWYQAKCVRLLVPTEELEAWMQDNPSSSRKRKRRRRA